MRSINEATVLGNLGDEPKIRETKSGTRVANLSIATNRNYKRDGEWKSDTEWHRIVAWDYEAQKAKGLRKGDPVLVQGRLQENEWVDQEGRERSEVQIVARRLIPLVDREEEPEKPSRDEKMVPGATEGGPGQETVPDDAPQDDSLPF